MTGTDDKNLANPYQLALIPTGITYIISFLALIATYFVFFSSWFDSFNEKVANEKWYYGDALSQDRALEVAELVIQMVVLYALVLLVASLVSNSRLRDVGVDAHTKVTVVAFVINIIMLVVSVFLSLMSPYLAIALLVLAPYGSYVISLRIFHNK